MATYYPTAIKPCLVNAAVATKLFW